MATTMYLRRMKRHRKSRQVQNKPAAKNIYAEMTFAEKSKAVWELVKSGKAQTQKEGWAIIKTWK